ncbi:MAG: ABC transporter ATP-binding protein [Chloroflexi bacterium]|nr:ABC transporter ATP-binding protein [Chloroflexota bacterium]
METVALRGVDLEVAPGDYVALIGRSGSGKSTLIGLIAGADRPSAGRVVVAGVDLGAADEPTRTRLRGTTIGIVFQSANLVDFLDLAENVQLTCALAGIEIDRATAVAALAAVGLGAAARRRAARLSGGEQQRAALAMILASRPSLILADEITGELDSATAAVVLDLLDEVRRKTGATVIVATHDPAVAARANRVVELRDGKVAS